MFYTSCRQLALYMLFICCSYALHMLFICSLYAVHMLFICSSYALHMLFICCSDVLLLDEQARDGFVRSSIYRSCNEKECIALRNTVPAERLSERPLILPKRYPVRKLNPFPQTRNRVRQLIYSTSRTEAVEKSSMHFGRVVR